MRHSKKISAVIVNDAVDGRAKESIISVQKYFFTKTKAGFGQAQSFASL